MPGENELIVGVEAAQRYTGLRRSTLDKLMWLGAIKRCKDSRICIFRRSDLEPWREELLKGGEVCARLRIPAWGLNKLRKQGRIARVHAEVNLYRLSDVERLRAELEASNADAT
ncbi:MAG: hypothetical protein KDD66_13695 [Bdellovibrionales bacterium]|nr:hypothetical protein [Planctomycetales bacterium]MCB0346166.1 hypothetical protein [Bdellovibrionales bacterium]